jgi:hypothetical protein
MSQENLWTVFLFRGGPESDHSKFIPLKFGPESAHHSRRRKEATSLRVQNNAVNCFWSDLIARTSNRP